MVKTKIQEVLKDESFMAHRPAHRAPMSSMQGLSNAPDWKMACMQQILRTHRGGHTD